MRADEGSDALVLGSAVTSRATPGTSTPTPPSIERKLGARFEILALLGAGATGTVYRARDLELDEIVALKVLRRELASAEESLEMLRREVKLARRVTHRNVARVYDLGEHEGERVLSMELVEGESLGAALARGGAFPVARAVAVALEIARGLDAAHAAGVIHRDLKPENVLLDRDGRAILTDFGVARAVTMGTSPPNPGASAAGAANSLVGVVGTPAYMAPEQIEARPDVDARADVYAFGAVLYELCTGVVAWPSASPWSQGRLLGPAPDPRAKVPDLPAPLADLVVRCLSRRREDRPASMAEVALALDALSLAVEPPAPLSPAEELPAEPALPAASDKTIAVLPFRNAGPPEDAYLAEELTDDLVDALCMTHGLRVRARGTLPRASTPEADARAIGLAAGVEAVVEGTVRRARGHDGGSRPQTPGGGVRMTVRVVGVADGFQLWAKRWDRSEQDVLAINAEAAQGIAAALGIATGAPARAPASDAEAVDLYLRARQEYRRFWPGALRNSLALFEQALARSPDDAIILSGMASALARLSFFDPAGEGDLTRARAAAERAVAAAPDAGEPHLALGSVLFQLGEVPAAVRSLRAAVLRAPGLSEGQGALGRVFAEVGAVPEAERRLEASLLLDPEALPPRMELTRVAALFRRWDHVDAHLAALRGDKPGLRFWVLHSRYDLWRGRRFEDAAYGAEIARNEGPLALASRLVYALHEHGRLPDGAPDLLAVADAVPGLRGRLYLYQITAEIHGFLGEIEPAITAVEKAARQGLLDRLWLERCPLLDRVRDHPRYPAAHAEVARRTEAILAAYREA
jgi:eukaryotic-like serine/threonine-protein kinase